MLQIGAYRRTRTFKNLLLKQVCLPIAIMYAGALWWTRTTEGENPAWFTARCNSRYTNNAWWVWQDLNLHEHNAQMVLSHPCIPFQPHTLGGDDRDRTCDLVLAKHTLSQLSYIPKTLQVYHTFLQKSTGNKKTDLFSRRTVFVLILRCVLRLFLFCWFITLCK